MFVKEQLNRVENETRIVSSLMTQRRTVMTSTIIV